MSRRNRALPIVLLAVAGALVLPGCGGAGNQMAPAGRQTMSREAFRTAVEGKTPDEVIKAVGKPDSTQDIGGDPTWYYRNRTTDPATGAVDDKAQVEFRDGRVAGVNYF
jgi:outer membrane protein assembly factor BamE (lipoprotein component of BamABCDE complex)